MSPENYTYEANQHSEELTLPQGGCIEWVGGLNISWIELCITRAALCSQLYGMMRCALMVRVMQEQMEKSLRLTERCILR